MFIVTLTYTCDLKEIDALLDEHVAFLKRNYDLGLFLLSGRQVPRTGGVILARAESREQLLDVLEQDPFKRTGAARYDIMEMVPSMAAKGLEGLIEG